MALESPYKAKLKLGRLSCRYKRYLPHDIGVSGSYYTGNIGDRAIGQIIKRELSDRGYRTFLYSRGEGEKSGSTTLNILGGGGVLHDWQGTEMLRNRLEFLSAGDAIVGVGAPGIRSIEARRIVRDRLSKVELVTVRDERSKQILEKVCGIDVQVTACPAWLHSDPDVNPRSRTGINFRPWFDLPAATLTNYFGYEEGIDTDRGYRRYIKNAQRICDAMNDPIFIPFKQKDEMFARRHLDVDVLEYDFSVQRTLERVSSVDRMVCTRYHSLVFAGVCRTPVLPIAYAPKVASLADRLDVTAFKPYDEIPVQFQVPKNVSTLEAEALRNFDLLESLLN